MESEAETILEIATKIGKKQGKNTQNYRKNCTTVESTCNNVIVYSIPFYSIYYKKLLKWK